MEKYKLSENEQHMIEKSRIPFAVYQMIDKRVVTIAVSDGFCELLGYKDRNQAYFDMDHDMYKDTYPDDIARISDAAFRFAAEDEKYDVIYRSKKPGGEGYFILHAKGEHVITDDGVRLAYIWYTDEGDYSDSESGKTDVNRSLNKALYQLSLYEQGYFDYLTGLPNMTYFFDIALENKNAFEEHGMLPAILFMDLNGMKFFNRKYGFAEGNALLRAYAKLLAQHFGSENCSRFGQDHFVVSREADGLEERIRNFLEDCKNLNGGNSLTVRVGVYINPGERVDVSVACDRAKYACDALRGTYVSGIKYFDDSMKEEIEKRHYIIDSLDRALSEKWIQVYYQAIVRATNGKVCDEEALARWVDPVQGVLSPAEFIPILEESGLIYKLDLYMVESILEKLRDQEENGIPLVPQSVNLSRVDFDACDMVEEICSRVDASGLPRKLLNIEITESIVGKEFDFMKTQIDRFRQLGFQVWMDDFGSGYSSLDLLQSLRFDLIKFDLNFMQKFNQEERGKVIMTELIKMAVSLEIDTVCEGVETEEQAQFLREIGCGKLQGYLFSRPVPFKEILRRFQNGFSIGFENPQETEYYDTVCSINLYDLSMIANEDTDAFSRYFNTLPMAIVEVKGEEISFMRSNQSYRDFIKRHIGLDMDSEHVDFSRPILGKGESFLQMVKTCCKTGKRAFLDERISESTVVHSFVRKIAENPVTGISAVAVAVLAIMDDVEGVTYAHIARALAADYFNIFYVNLNTEKFIEYSSQTGIEELAVKQAGDDFFRRAREDSKKLLYKRDQKSFLTSFTKENVLDLIEKQGSFSISYRVLVDGKPEYVLMKAMKMQEAGPHIIIGVASVDAQMQQKEALDRIQREQILSNRITSLAGNYICIYLVDPETDHYEEVFAEKAYKTLKISKSGEDFFKNSLDEAIRTAYPEDLSMVAERFTKENVMGGIENHGLYVLQYRLVINGEPVYVELRGSMIEEDGQKRLIIGINNVNDQVRREQAYKRSVDISSLVIDSCVRLMGRDDFEGNVGGVVEDVRAAADAAACRIVLMDHEKKETQVYCEQIKEGVWTDRAPVEKIVSYDLLCTWRNVLENKNFIIVRNEEERVELGKKNPAWAENMLENDIQSMIATPLVQNKAVIGYFYIVNYDISKTAEMRELIELVSFFLGSEISNHLYLKRLEIMSTVDDLTGLKNRYAMMRRNVELETVDRALPFGILTIDLNGLKRVNDEEGHMAGDYLIVQTAELLKKSFPDEDLFRIGGDEFIVMFVGITEEMLKNKVETFASGNLKESGISLAMGYVWSAPGENVQNVFQRADIKMYENKKAYYDKRPELKK